MRLNLLFFASLVLISGCGEKKGIRAEAESAGGRREKDEAFYHAVSYRNIYASVLAGMKPGVSIEDFKTLAHTLGQHEITFQDDDGRTIAIYSVYIVINPGDELNVDNEMVWAIFRDNHYMKITYYVNHSSRDGLININSKEGDIESVLIKMKNRGMKAESGDDYVFHNKIADKNKADFGLSLAFSIIGQSVSSSVKSAYIANYQRLIKYSGDSLHIGEDIENSERTLGNATETIIDEKSPQLELRKYGINENMNVSPQDLARPVIVIYKSGKVAMALNNEFYLECVGYP